MISVSHYIQEENSNQEVYNLKSFMHILLAYSSQGGDLTGVCISYLLMSQEIKRIDIYEPLFVRAKIESICRGLQFEELHAYTPCIQLSGWRSDWGAR